MADYNLQGLNPRARRPDRMVLELETVVEAVPCERPAVTKSAPGPIWT